MEKVYTEQIDLPQQKLKTILDKQIEREQQSRLLGRGSTLGVADAVQAKLKPESRGDE